MTTKPPPLSEHAIRPDKITVLRDGLTRRWMVLDTLAPNRANNDRVFSTYAGATEYVRTLLTSVTTERVTMEPTA